MAKAINSPILIMEVKNVEGGQVEITQLDGEVFRMSAQVWSMRCLMIKQGMEWEMRFPGGRLTRGAPSCFVIARNEFGIRGRDKVKAYRAFCDLVGMEADPSFVMHVIKTPAKS